MTAFYNERDPYAAEWLRNLIAAGHIAPGVVSEEDIRDLRPADLAGYTQCHFFAGIGVWSHALRAAGWADDRPVWTGSCPCQPFSAAGRRAGVADERHLWPHWHWLIDQCRPATVFGEQVASKDGLGWLDLVSADMEGSGYAFGASDLCAAGVTVEWEESQTGQWLRRAIHDCTDPVIARMLGDFADWAGAGNLGDGGEHIRQRLYFVGMADADRGERDRITDGEGCQRDGAPTGWQQGDSEPQCRGADGGVADALPAGRAERRAVAGSGQVAGRGSVGGMADAASTGRRSKWADGYATDVFEADTAGQAKSGRNGADCRPHAPMLGRHAADWLFCRDGKWRPVEPGTFPLAHAAPARVGRLRAYGNALDAETAAGFVAAVMEAVEMPAHVHRQQRAAVSDCRHVRCGWRRVRAGGCCFSRGGRRGALVRD